VFFDSWQGLGRVVIVGALAYVALVCILRVSGNRTLSKLNAFDLVVTVALGSTLSTILLDKDVPLAEGTLAVLVLVGLQFCVTWSSVRWPYVRRAVKSDPVLLVHRGRGLPDALRRARVTNDEILAVLRREGIARLDDVDAVMLESDGSLSVVPSSRTAQPGRSPLENVVAPS
jgi:uncharacterized membrane protein YcaP (DUF421 family)